MIIENKKDRSLKPNSYGKLKINFPRNQRMLKKAYAMAIKYRYCLVWQMNNAIKINPYQGSSDYLIINDKIGKLIEGEISPD